MAQEAVAETRHPVTWYRGTIFSAWMVACIAFSCTGMFGALNGMGAGGGRSPEVANAANAIVFGLIATCSWFVGGICNKIGPKWTLLVSHFALPHAFTKQKGAKWARRSVLWDMHHTLLVSMSWTSSGLAGFRFLVLVFWVSLEPLPGRPAAPSTWATPKKIEEALQVRHPAAYAKKFC